MIATFFYIIYLIILLGSLALVPLGLPGLWLMVGTTLIYSIFVTFNPGHSDWWVILISIGLATIGEIFEFAIGIIAAKKLNVSTGGVIASVIGGFIGTIVGIPGVILGSLLGLFAGTFLGAFLYELATKQNPKQALNAAFAAFFSRVTAMFVKTFVGIILFVYLLVSAW